MKKSRQLRTLGAAVLAVALIAAVSASAAQAGTFTAGAFPATLTGSAVGNHELTTELGTMECAPSFHGEQAAAAAEVTLVPNYGAGCMINGLEVDVFRNGCDFALHAGNTLAMDEVSGSMDIKCPEGNRLDFVVTGMALCHLTIPAQEGIGPITYTDRTAAKDVDIDFNVVSILHGLHGAGCPVVGPFPNATYVGTSTLRTDNEGMPTPNTVD
jgi:hypothetical protein